MLIIGSEDDALTPLEHSRTLAQALPKAELIVAPNSGHLLMLEHPEVVNHALVGLIDSVLPAKTRSRRPA